MFADIHPQAESLSYDHPLIRNKQLLNHQTQIMIQRLGLIQRRVSPAPLTRHDPQTFAAGQLSVLFLFLLVPPLMVEKSLAPDIASLTIGFLVALVDAVAVH